jgi:hypothetical protein
MSASAMAPPRELPVGREFLGMARSMRNRIDSIDPVAVAAMGEISRRLQARCRRRQHLTPSVSAEAVRAWRTHVPDTGRLAIETHIGHRSLFIRELRLSRCRTRNEAWQDAAWEQGVGVMLISLTIQVFSFQFNYFHLAVVSLHALARRFQRGIDNSDAAILADLRVIADVAAEIAVTHGAFEIAVPGGRWGGYIVEMPDENGPHTRVLSIRTFLPAEEE